MSLERNLVVEALPAYEIRGELGRGGWGVVLEGWHRQLDREVAIKQLPRAFAADPDVRSRFLAEARLLASLDHPHIVPVYDFVERDGLCLLVMEKLPGGTVWTRFTERRLTMEAVCGIGLATAVALHHAHARGVLHRDVKPENLMFSGTGVMKVTDFGIAKVLAGGRTMATRAGDVLGTPAYMAPEQALGEQLGPGTDIYAVGVMLYELLSGRLPFAESPESAMAILYQHVHETPTPLDTVAPAVPSAVAGVVMQAIEKSAADRYESAEAFAVALGEAATSGFGPGWLARSGVTLMATGPVVAATEDATVDSAAAIPSSPTAAPRSGDGTSGRVTSAAGVAPDELVAIDDLAEAPDSLAGLGSALRRVDSPDALRMAAEVERLESSAHEVRELQLLQRHRSGASPFRKDDWEEVERLLGAYGTDAATRLGLDQDASAEAIREAALAVRHRWQRRAESPLSSRELSSAARILVRTCEGVLNRFSETPGA